MTQEKSHIENWRTKPDDELCKRLTAARGLHSRDKLPLRCSASHPTGLRMTFLVEASTLFVTLMNYSALPFLGFARRPFVRSCRPARAMLKFRDHSKFTRSKVVHRSRFARSTVVPFDLDHSTSLVLTPFGLFATSVHSVHAYRATCFR